MKRKGSAVWQGAIKEGSGTVSTESGVLDDVPYSFAKRFDDEKGTNPEELIGAAHAGCFSMALSGALGAAGMTADEIATSAAGHGRAGRRRLHHHRGAPDREGEHPRRRPEAFQTAAEGAKAGCPVSKVLNATITMDAKLAL